MTLKMTFLGSGSAFTVGAGNYHSNVLLQKDNQTLLIDAGGDLRLSLNEHHLTYKDIQNVYISHLHADHVGGMEWLALNCHFDKTHHYKPNLYLSTRIVDDLWEHSLSGGLRTLVTEPACLETFFKVHAIQPDGQFVWQEVQFTLVEAKHVQQGYAVMPCAGLFITYHDTHIYFTADTQFVPQQLLNFYEKATIIFHDCETYEQRTGVHAHYTELVTLPAAIKQKMWLYHYNAGTLPNAVADGFLGFVKKGQQFLFE